MSFRVNKFWFYAVLVTGMVSPALADLTWFNNSTNLVYYQDGVTPLFGIKGSNSVSCFLQLIYAGANAVPDEADIVNSAQGTSGDDVAADWSSIGTGLVGAPGSPSHYGRVNVPAFVDEIADGYYYVRAWTAPSPDFLNGSVPTSFTNFYVNSALIQALEGFEQDAAQNFNFGGNGLVANLSPVPEPRTFLLALMGLCSLCRWVRRANSTP